MPRQNLVFDPSTQQWVPGETPRTMSAPFEGPGNRPIEVRVSALEQGMGGGGGDGLATVDIIVLTLQGGSEDNFTIVPVKISVPVAAWNPVLEPADTHPNFALRRQRIISAVEWDKGNAKMTEKSLSALVLSYKASSALTEAQGIDTDIASFVDHSTLPSGDM